MFNLYKIDVVSWLGREKVLTSFPGRVIITDHS